MTAIKIEATDTGYLLKRGGKALVHFHSKAWLSTDQLELIEMFLTAVWACAKTETVYQLKQHVAKFNK